MLMSDQRRLNRLRGIMRQAKLDVLALIPGPNHRYLTQAAHFAMERPIVMFIPLEEAPLAVIPELEIPLFERHPISSRIFSWTDAEGYDQAFAAALDVLQTRGKIIGVEGLQMRFFEAEIIRGHAPDAAVVDASRPLAEWRIIKDAAEIAALRRAIQISEDALRATLDNVRAGMSEREIAADLEARIKALGGHGLAFDIILHGGGNTALPHCGPLDYRLQRGDPLLIDFGASFDGYCADITRTVFVGEVSEEHRRFYAVARAANAAGRRAAGPGVTAESVDAAARQVIIDAGCEHLMRHRTGHGLGLQAHEAPYIVQGNQRILRPGMVFTIEPGIYRLGEIGVRIEDDVLITDDGCESLTTFPREILALD